MRIRYPIAGLFVLGCVFAAFLGFRSDSPVTSNRDKLLHVALFFMLTVLFYWSIDTHRKRAVNITLVVCCFCASIGSEALQHFITRASRKFDIDDIAANLIGSLFATVLSSLYHGRLMERRKRARYECMRQDVEGAISADISTEHDVELSQMEPETA